MKQYKIVFCKNEVLSCKLSVRQFTINKREGRIIYEHDGERKQLVYAIVLAECEEGAMAEAKKIIAGYTAAESGN